MSAAEGATARRVRIPADVEREDRLVFDLTARQLAILGAGAVGCWLLFAITRHLLPLPVSLGVIAPVGGGAALLALGHVGGISADRLALFAWRHHRSPHRLVTAPDGVPPGQSVLGLDPGPGPDPLHLPLTGVEDDVVDLGPEGQALLCRASAVTFALRTSAEQEGLVAAFGRFLDSLSEPLQIVVRAEPVDLVPVVRRLEEAAPSLPHPGLEDAARDHAAFLCQLAEHTDLLRRQVSVVFRQAARSDGPSRLHRRAEQATTALAGAGVTLEPLGGGTVEETVARALDPFGMAFVATGARGDEPVARRREHR